MPPLSTLAPQQEVTTQPPLATVPQPVPLSPARVSTLTSQAQRHQPASLQEPPPTTLPHVLPTSLTRRRDDNYSREKVMSLLLVLRDAVPVSKNDCDNILASHSKIYPGGDVL